MFREFQKKPRSGTDTWNDGHLNSTGLIDAPGDTCFLIVAGVFSARALRAHYSIAPWAIVEVPIETSSNKFTGRRASRRLKLLPHLYFLAEETRFTIFMDWKLELHADPRTLLHAVTVGRAPHPPSGFAALRHPCTTTYYATGTPVYVHRMCQNFQNDNRRSWYREEAKAVIHAHATSNPNALEKQVARYGVAALYEFAEGALLIRDREHPVSGSLNCAWWAEYTRVDSSDRDQIALAYVLASSASPLSSMYHHSVSDTKQSIVSSGNSDPRLFSKSTEQGGVFIISEGGSASSCKNLCHWYHGRPGSPSIGALLPKQGNKRLPKRNCEALWWCRHNGSLQSPID